MAQVFGSIPFEETIIDNLTGLFNHTYFYETLRKEIEKTVTFNLPLSLALLNLDSFSGYNASYGYFQGDFLLKKTGEIIRHSVRESDILCRYRGDEFAVIFPQTNSEKAFSLSDKIRVKMEQTLIDLPSETNIPQELDVISLYLILEFLTLHKLIPEILFLKIILFCIVMFDEL